jgi:phosphate starvation-inducible PhoH-like protein
MHHNLLLLSVLAPSVIAFSRPFAASSNTHTNILRLYSAKKITPTHTTHPPHTPHPKPSKAPIAPLTPNQHSYNSLLSNPNTSIIICTGPAGTGKTLLACTHAANSLINGLYSKIIITRPTVSVDEELGFLPGSIIKKMDPFTKPIFDILNEHLPKKTVDNMLADGTIEIAPLAFMRGRTFKNAFIIADEMQNATPAQMKMCITRLGSNSKMCITGDLSQSDRTDDKTHPTNGLKDIRDRINAWNATAYASTPYISLCDLDNCDILRHPAVAFALNLYNTPIQPTTTYYASRKFYQDGLPL